MFSFQYSADTVAQVINSVRGHTQMFWAVGLWTPLRHSSPLSLQHKGSRRNYINTQKWLASYKENWTWPGVQAGLGLPGLDGRLRPLNYISKMLTLSLYKVKQDQISGPGTERSNTCPSWGHKSTWEQIERVVYVNPTLDCSSLYKATSSNCIIGTRAEKCKHFYLMVRS